MKRSLWYRLDSFARQLTPFGLTLILVMIGLVPSHLPGFAHVAPMLPLMAIYHWTIYRPELMPAAAVFVIGLVEDALVGTPLGVNALIFLIAYGIVLTQRRFFVGKSFPIVWLGFALVGAGVGVIQWALISAIHVVLVDGRAGFFQYLVTLGAFPFLSWFFVRWQQAIIRPD